MKYAPTRYIGLLAGIGFTIVAAAISTIASIDYNLSWHVIDSAGGSASGGAYELTGSFGQADAGPMLSGGGFEVVGGFWLAPMIPPTSNGECPADIAPPGGNLLVNTDDLLFVISQWGSAVGGAGGAADIAPPGGDGMVDVDDLLVVIAAWGKCP